ncbi:MAG: hypothetical protein AB7F78_02650 [Hyphomicrobiaceae bacterium]
MSKLTTPSLRPLDDAEIATVAGGLVPLQIANLSMIDQDRLRLVDEIKRLNRALPGLPTLPPIPAPLPL